MRKECRLCGAGGQGIILAGIILAEAAGIYEGKYVTQTQDYGPAARGDSSKTDVIISDDAIDYPKCSSLDLLVALSQRAFDENKALVREGGILIVDSNNVTPANGEGTHKFPISEVASKKAGSPLSVNMVALGIIAAITGFVKIESVRESMLRRIPAHSKEANLAALIAGYRLSRVKRRKGKKVDVK